MLHQHQYRLWNTRTNGIIFLIFSYAEQAHHELESRNRLIVEELNKKVEKLQHIEQMYRQRGTYSGLGCSDFQSDFFWYQTKMPSKQMLAK
jgi:hypothetical protein